MERIKATKKQERFLIAKEISNSNNVVPVVLKIVGDPNRKILENSINNIILRHESLRTQFSHKGLFQYDQKIRKAKPFKFEYIVDDNPFKYINERFDRRFDINTYPLFDIFFVEAGNDELFLCGVFDHSIFDGASYSIFIRDLEAYYNAGIDGENDIPLTSCKIVQPKKMAYDYDKNTNLKNMNYWLNKLNNDYEYAEIQSDKPRPSCQTSNGAEISYKLKRTLTAKVKVLATKNNTTVYTVIYTALNLLVYLYTGQINISTGFVSTGRKNKQEYRNTIGCFINNLILKMNLLVQDTFLANLFKLKENLNEALIHEEVNLIDIIKELRIPKDSSRNPLFQLLFNWYPRSNTQQFKGMKIEKIFPKHESHYDLTLYGFRSIEDVEFVLNYNSDLFTYESSSLLLKNLEYILEQIVENPLVKANEIILIKSQECNGNSEDEKNTNEYSRFDFVNEILINIDNKPDMTAVSDIEGEISYSDFGGIVYSFLNFLDKLKEGDTVGIYTGRNRFLPASILAVILKKGKFVILDEEYPPERNKEICKICNVTHLIFEDEYDTEFFNKIPLENTYSIKEISNIQNQDRELHQFIGEYSLDEESYYLFTSGSTGVPKGIRNTLRPLSQFLAWYKDEFCISENERFSMVSGLSHDPILRDILVPLVTGGRLCIPPKDIIRKPNEFLLWIESNKINYMHLTPAHLKIILMSDNISVSNLRSLKIIFSGGDKLSYDSIGNIFKYNKDMKIVNCYGATETPQIIGFKVLNSQMDFSNVSIGKGRPGTEIKIMRQGKCCGLQQIGEIVIKSKYLSLGYINSDMGERSPFYSDGEYKYYKTGDLGRYLLDGEVQCLGRIDSQVKINGVRIEPSDIDSKIQKIPGIIKSITCTVKTGERNQLATFYEYSDKKIESSEFSAILCETLPAYMIPAKYYPVDDIPLTPNGKIDRKKLSMIIQAREDVSCDKDIDFIYNIFTFLDEFDNISSKDSFVTLGGDSLSYIQSSMLLELFLGFLPDNWENLSIEEIGRLDKKKGRRIVKLEIQELIRALSISFIVLSHSTEILDARINIVERFSGFTFVLFALAGFNYARFQSKRLFEGEWLLAFWALCKRVLIPYMLFLIPYQIYKRHLYIPDLLLFTNLIGWWKTESIFFVWFIQLLLQCFLIISLLFSMKRFRDVGNKNKWLFSLFLLFSSFFFSLIIPLLWNTDYQWNRVPQKVLWVIMLGWSLFFATDRTKKIQLMFIILGALVLSRSIDLGIDVFFACSFCLILIWIKAIPTLKIIRYPVQIVASSSYYIYLTHMSFFSMFLRLNFPDVTYIYTVFAIILGCISKYLFEKAFSSIGSCIKSFVHNKSRIPTKSIK